jgi:hypothetical protein
MYLARGSVSNSPYWDPRIFQCSSQCGTIGRFKFDFVLPLPRPWKARLSAQELPGTGKLMPTAWTCRHRPSRPRSSLHNVTSSAILDGHITTPLDSSRFQDLTDLSSQFQALAYWIFVQRACWLSSRSSCRGNRLSPIWTDLQMKMWGRRPRDPALVLA